MRLKLTEGKFEQEKVTLCLKGGDPCTQQIVEAAGSLQGSVAPFGSDHDTCATGNLVMRRRPGGAIQRPSPDVHVLPWTR